MERNLLHWSYWLGITCSVVALLRGSFNALGVWFPMQIAAGQTINYMSFHKASLLFFVTAIASANYAWLALKGQHSKRRECSEHLFSRLRAQVSAICIWAPRTRGETLDGSASP